MTARAWKSAALCAVFVPLFACGGGGDDDSSDGGAAGGAGGAGGAAAAPIAFVEASPPAALAHGAAYDEMARVAALDSFGADNLGDPADFSASTAESPSEPEVIASLFFETAGLAAAVAAVADARTGVAPTPDFGATLTAQFVQDLTAGGVAIAAPDERGGVRFLAWHAVRTLDAFLLLQTLNGLTERSSGGFDQALALLWDAEGAPQALGRRIAAADAACGTHVLAELRAGLAAVRQPFASALAEKGELDPLDRRLIRVGDCPEYDAFLLQADRLLHEGLAVALLAGLAAETLSSIEQAQALGTYKALSARLAAQNPDGDLLVQTQLDQLNPAAVNLAGTDDEPGIRAIVTAAFGVGCAP